MRALLVEDDLLASAVIELVLKSGGITVHQVDTGEEALELARYYDYDIMILDLMLPDMQGVDVVRRMRAARIETPVIILSGLGLPAVKVEVFQAGADDFLTKPFDKAELLARVRAVTRRGKGFSQPALRVGPLVLNLDSREVTLAGRIVSLTGKEYSMLELLVLRKGLTITREEFLTHLYGGTDEPEAKIVDVFICKLRRKLGDAGTANLINTVWGRGYIFRVPAKGDREGDALDQNDVPALLEGGTVGRLIG